jgi:hypothetical protein
VVDGTPRAAGCATVASPWRDCCQPASAATAAIAPSASIPSVPLSLMANQSENVLENFVRDVVHAPKLIHAVLNPHADL